MTTAATIAVEAEQRRTRVKDHRVACWRIGSVDVDRCLECPYLIRLEHSGAAEPAAAHVVCADGALDAEVDFAW